MPALQNLGANSINVNYIVSVIGSLGKDLDRGRICSERYLFRGASIRLAIPRTKRDTYIYLILATLLVYLNSMLGFVGLDQNKRKRWNRRSMNSTPALTFIVGLRLS